MIVRARTQMTIAMAKFPKINKKLLPLKIVMFGWFGATSCVLPYMTIHMKELGITVEETAIIYTLLPITQFLASPIAGFIADKLGKYRDVLLLSVIMTVILGTALLYVPPSTPRTLRTWTMCNNEGLHIVREKCHDTPCANLSDLSVLKLSECECLADHCPESECQTTLSGIANETFTLNVEMSTGTEEYCRYRVISAGPEKSMLPQYPSCIPPDVSRNCTSNIKCNIKMINENSDVKDSVCQPTWQSSVLTVWLYSVLRIIYNIFSSIAFTLVDSSAIAMTEAEEDQYGRQRFWAIMAMGIFSPLSGLLVDMVSAWQGYLTYAPAFHAYNVLALATIFAAWYLDIAVAIPEDDTLKNLWKLAKMPAICALLIVVFWLGTVWGFLESFLFWFLLELGSPTYMLGLTLTVGSFVGLPFLHHAEWIVSKIGHVNVLTISLLTYLVRCVGYSFLTDSWLAMLFETMEIFTYHLMWVAAATYSAMLSPPGLLATIQGCVGGIHYGVGQGSGSLIGGSLMSALGARAAFQVMGGISGCFGLCYGLLYFVCLRKTHNKLDIEAQKKIHIINSSAVEKSIMPEVTVKSNDQAPTEANHCNS